VNVEEQVRAAMESVALATRPEERGAYQRFLRRRAHRDRMQAAAAAVLLLVLLAGAVVLPGQLRRPPAMAGATESLTVDVTAFQWGWRFAYAGTRVRANGGLGRTPELVVPADRRSAFGCTPTTSCIHSRCRACTSSGKRSRDG